MNKTKQARTPDFFLFYDRPLSLWIPACAKSSKLNDSPTDTRARIAKG